MMTVNDFDNRPAPLPKNWRAMMDAASDPTAFAREQAVYAQQLRDEGFYVEDQDLEQVEESAPPVDRFAQRADLQ